MGVPFVQSNQVTAVNSQNWAWPTNPNGTPMQIPCENTQIIGSFWRVPQTQGNRVTGYTDLTAVNQTVKPQPDAIKILRVKLTDTGGITTLDMAIADGDNVATASPPNQFAYLCDGNGGTLPVMPTVVIPIPIQQLGPQTQDATTGDRTFVFPFPANPAGLEYNIEGIWLDGAAPTPAYAPSGITTVAGVVTYANSNWSRFGTWSASSTNVLQLVSTTGDVQYVAKAGIVVALAPKAYCIDLTAFSTPAAVNGVKFGTGNTIPVPAFLLTDNNATLYNVLQKIMSSGTSFNTTIAHKLGITTVQGIVHLYEDTSLVASSTAGACS